MYPHFRVAQAICAWAISAFGMMRKGYSGRHVLPAKGSINNDGGAPVRKSRRCSGWSVLCLAVAMAGTVAVPATASEEPQPADAQEATISLLEGLLPREDQTSHTFWAWGKGQRGFDLVLGQGGFGKVRSFNLGTGEIMAEMLLDPPGYSRPSSPVAGTHTAGHAETVALDQAGGRVFIPYTRGMDAGGTQDGSVCVDSTTGGQGCIAGVHVIDGESLDSVRKIPVRNLRVDGGAIGQYLLAIQYAEPRAAGDAPKLHLLMNEIAYHHANAAVSDGPYARGSTTTVTYLTQLDPESGAQDWTVRVDACRGNREDPRNQTYNHAFIVPMPYRAALLRGPSLDDPAVYVACTAATSSLQSAVVKVPLDDRGMASSLPVTVAPAGLVEDELLSGQPQPAGWAGQSAGQTAVFGPDRVYAMLADPGSGRLLLRVTAGSPRADVWWVFDTRLMQFIGTIGIGAPVKDNWGMYALDQSTGRLYVAGQPYRDGAASFAAGLYVADVRRTPVPQALFFPQFAGAIPEVAHDYWQRSLVVEPSSGDKRPTRVYMPNHGGGDSGGQSSVTAYRVLEDRLPVGQSGPAVGFGGRTLDLAEAAGVTNAALDGAARGYGFRALLVGGVEAAARIGLADPVGIAAECNSTDWGKTGQTMEGLRIATPIPDGPKQAKPVRDLLPGSVGTPFTGRSAEDLDGGPCRELLNPPMVPLPLGCAEGNRELIAGYVGPDGPAVVDGTGSRGTAQPVVIDSATGADAEAPASRCTDRDWDELWGTALFGHAPADEPSSPERLPRLVECVSGDGTPSDRVGDAVASRLAAQVVCDPEEASGYAYAGSVGAGGVSVAEAVSSFRIYRDPSRGIVSRVESAARGINVPGLLSVNTVRGVAESWANGRRQPVAFEEREEGYDPNCDRERTAGTCFQRHVFGVRTPGWSCGPCGDEQKLADGLTKALGSNGAVRLRQPDPALAMGAENGYIAAVTKADSERFGDLVLNNDLLQTTLPSLEVIRYTSPNRPISGGGPRGRQIYQFAGVEVSSSYGISCLLVYDEATNTCAGEKQEPGAIEITLSDPDGKPLAGGAFEVRADVDADGVLGLKDTLLPDGACVTAEDGIGTCTFEGLQPGAYLVNQVAAPPGYAKTAEPWVSEVSSGERRTVAFTNVSNMSRVELKATDENGAPVAGAVFAAYPDPDSDGKVAPDAKPAAECTTDAEGVCAMSMPAGSYVLVQTSAPGGLDGIEPVAFTFASGGQVAAVTVVNYPPEQPAAPDAPASSVDYSAPVEAMPPTEVVDGGYQAPVDAVEPTVAPPITARVGDTITQVIRAPGDALRLLARDPKEAVAWTAALALFCLAAMSIRRRQAALALIQEI